jgi:cytochrome b
MLGIFLSLIGATVTGVALDRGKTVGMTAAAEVIAPAYADGDKKRDLKSAFKGEHENEGDEEDGLLEEAHEALSNLMMVFVAMHIAYIILFRWPLARFMLFISKGGSSRTK